MADTDDFTSLPLQDRLAHKSWKARVSGFEELTRLFGASPPDNTCFPRFQHDLKKFVTDSNMVAQDAGLSSVVAFLQNAPLNICSRLFKDLLPPVIEKALASTRATVRQKSIQIFILSVEITESGTIALELLLESLGNKQPRLVAQVLVTLKEIILAFGVKIINVKPVLKALAPVFAHADKNVRTEAFQLTVALWGFIGESIYPSLSDLKEVQLKDLKDAFAQTPVNSQPTSLTRSQMQMQFQPSSEMTDPNSMVMDTPMDTEMTAPSAYDLAEPEEVLKKIQPNFTELLESSKWKDRKEALEHLLSLVQHPRLKEDRYGELVSLVSKKINDANLLVGSLAVLIIEAMALGLKKDFSSYRSLVMGQLIEKLKEKKQSVVESIRKAMDAVFASTSLESNLEDILVSITHKNPQIKTEVVRFLTRCLCSTTIPISKADLKSMATSLLKTIDDSITDVRNASAEALGTLLKLMGEKAMNAYLEKVDSLKLAKIKEFSQTAVVRGVISKGNHVVPAASNTSSMEASNTASSISMAKSSRPAAGRPLSAQSSSNASLQDLNSSLHSNNTQSMFGGIPVASMAAGSSTLRRPPLKKSSGTKLDSSSSSASTSNLSSARLAPSSSNRSYSPSNVSSRRPAQQTQQQHLSIAAQGMQSSSVGSMAASPVLSKADYELLPGDSNRKLKRGQDDKGPHKWTYDPSRLDLVEYLKEQASFCFSPVWVQLFFSTGHYKERDHTQALQILDDYLVAGHPDTIHHSDVIFKYLTIRFYDTNTTMLFKCLDVVEHLLNVLDVTTRAISDYEANAFFPIFLMKVGDNKEVIRSRIRSLLVRFNQLYPASKLFSLILKATESKNAKVRSECIDELGCMIARNGFSCCSSRNLPALAVFISERDATVRNAALNTLVEVAKVIGETQLLKHVGRLAEKDKSMLEQKLKRAGIVDPVNEPMEIDPPRQSPRGSSRLNQGFRSASGSTPVPMPPAATSTITSTYQHSMTSQQQLPPQHEIPSPMFPPSHSPMLQSYVPTSALPVNTANLSYFPPPSSGPPMMMPYHQSYMQPPVYTSTVSNNMPIPAVSMPHHSLQVSPSPSPVSLLYSHPHSHLSFPTPMQRFHSHSSVSSASSAATTISNSPVAPILSQPHMSSTMLPLGGYPAADPSTTPSNGLLQGIPSNSHHSIPNSSSISTPVPFALPPSDTFPHPKSPEKMAPLDALSNPYDNSSYRNEAVMDFLITQVSSENPTQALDSLRQIEKILPSQAHVFLTHVDRLIVSIALQIRFAFSTNEHPNFTRLCRHLLKTLMQFFEVPELHAEISTDTLGRLITELLIRLLDEQLPSRDSGTLLVKVTNTLMSKILEKTKPNLIFAVLLSLLADALVAAPETHEKYAELVMKCLWKVMRQLPEMARTPNVLDVPTLLSGIHNFFEAIHVSEWRKRNHPLGDFPVRTMKTILSELCQAHGDAILQYFYLIRTTDAYIYTYTVHLLQTQQQHALTRSESTLQDTPIDESTPPPPVTPAPGPRIDVHAELTEIFAKVGSKDQSKEGILALHNFKQAYPDKMPEIQRFINETSQVFQSYIKRNLAMLEKEDSGLTASDHHLPTFDSTDPNASAASTVFQLRNRIAKMKMEVQKSSASATAPSSSSALSALR